MKENYEIQRRFIYSFLNTIIIITLFLTMLKLININILKSNADYIYNLGNSWKNGPITSLKIINKNHEPNQNCEDFNMEPLFEGNWEGTVKGCEIDNVIVPYECHLYGNTFSPYEKIKYKYWDNVEICAERQNKTYFDLVIVKTNCPPNYKVCGIVDNLDNILCVDIKENCPINYIMLVDKSSTNIDINNKSYLETNNKLLYYSIQSTNSKIINEVKISDQVPCINPKYKNNFPNSTYELDIYFKYSNCENFTMNSIPYNL